MRPGDLIGDRFELKRLAGYGGMSEVFLAHDRTTDNAVAVKVLLEGGEQDQGRFEREARALAGLQHPRIVRYVAHGVTISGEPYLAMEWLEGEDLQSRLRHGRLEVEECVMLARHVAEALAIAHGRGVIHRDLKPSNLFLVDGSLERVKVLDFGIARLGSTTRMTQTGLIIGTPGYMAPEQARGDTELTPGADIFALGCVLFEALTGAPVFKGENLMAVLAKILFPETRKVTDLRPDVPADLGELIDRMLAREPSHRPPDGATLLAELDGLSMAMAHTDAAPELPVPSRPSFLRMEGEQRLLSVMLIGRENPFEIGAMATIKSAQATLAERQLRRTVERRGGHFETLLDGTFAITLAGTGMATDRAGQAALCALSLRAIAGHRPISLSTGRGEVTARPSLGDVIDRAAKMLEQVTRGAEQVDEPADTTFPIAIDEVTAGLLDARFDVRRGDRGYELYGEHDLDKNTRLLLGKPSPCVGRDRELGSLAATFSECVSESQALAVLVTAPPGIGKSRLAQEFIRGLKRRDEPVEIWMARGDGMRAGSPFGLLAQVLRSACGITEGEPLQARLEKLHARVHRHVVPPDDRRVSEFIGEIMGVRFSDTDSPPLRAARQDAQLMALQMQRAWEDFLRAESTACPVLIVLEHLHWGDPPTVRFIDAALGALHDKPCMVLALARPEVHDAFPRLWADRNMQEIRLKELTRKASERLVRLVLGDALGEEAVERLVTQAAGHAFYLEELIRAAAERTDAALPETVVAMVQSRLEGLEPEARRTLRAASIFGEVFWPGGIAALLGGPIRSTPDGDWLSVLIEREIIVPRSNHRFPNEPEFAFGHALLREGAYRMLTDQDRALGHRLAAQWLEQAGETDAVTLAEHFERGRDLARAGRYYLRAAEQALFGSDTHAVLSLARRGLACNVSQEMKAELLALLCDAHGWRNERAAAAAWGTEVIQLSKPGTTPWIRAAQATLVDAFYRGDTGEPILEAVRDAEPDPDARSTFAQTLATAVFMLDSMGQFNRAQAFLDRLHAIADPIADHDPVASGWMNLIHATRAALVHEDPWTGLHRAEAAQASFLLANHRRGALFAQVFTGIHAYLLGMLTHSERALRDTMAADEELGLASSLRTLHLIEVLIQLGKLDEALGLALHMVEAGHIRGLGVHEGRGRWILARLHHCHGDTAAAEREILAAHPLLAAAPLDQLAARATLAAILLAENRLDEALACAEYTISQYEQLQAFGHRGAFARLVHAEALHATGHHQAARQAVTKARDRLLANAEKIEDPDARRGFLQHVPENARTLELARQWCRPSERAPAS